MLSMVSTVLACCVGSLAYFLWHRLVVKDCLMFVYGTRNGLHIVICAIPDCHQSGTC
jgi:hypothetical protein